MFVNYFAGEERSSPMNLGIARVVVGGWLVWKTGLYDWQHFLETPFYFVTPEFAWAVPPIAPGLVLTLEKWLLLGLLFAFVVGYRIRVTAGTSALLVAHLGTVRMTLATSGETTSLFIGTYLLLLFAMFADTDVLSVDGLRKTESESTASLRARLVSNTESYRMPALKWGLVVLALIYFGSGFDKIFHEGLLAGPSLAFIAPENLTRIIVVRTHHNQWPIDIGRLLIEYPLLVSGLATLTLGLELGLLVAVLAGVTVTPIVLGILGFQTSVLIVLGIFFVDAYPLFLAFAAWDWGFEWISRDREIDLLFDCQRRFCMRGLLPFAFIDVAGKVSFHAQQDAPEVYRTRDDVDFDSPIHVFADGVAYEGYTAVRELLRQFRVFDPLVWLMEIPVVESFGRRGYRYVVGRGDHEPASTRG